MMNWDELAAFIAALSTAQQKLPARVAAGTIRQKLALVANYDSGQDTGMPIAYANLGQNVGDDPCLWVTS